LVLKGLRILIVAAAPTKVTSLTNILAPAGDQIADVSSGAVARELCPRFEPDLILLDGGLPDPNAFEFCAR
jgi:CheY-like chemotaxis protein